MFTFFTPYLVNAAALLGECKPMEGMREDEDEVAERCMKLVPFKYMRWSYSDRVRVADGGFNLL